MLQSDDSLFEKIREFIQHGDSFTIFVPYIQSDVLIKLLEGTKNNPINTIVTSWKPKDVALGISDIEVYPYCRDNNINLLINNRIHLKAYSINEYESCLVTSSNISTRGLAIASNFNFELGTFVQNLDTGDKIYFDAIIEGSTKITQNYYDQVKSQLSDLELRKDMGDDFEIQLDESAKDFLLTSLPMSDDVDILTKVYLGDVGKIGEEIIRSAEHDFRLYSIPKNLSPDSFRERLKKAYFSHPFINAFLEYNGEGKHFGELTKWLHNNCTTVPTPRRFEMKEALQRLFKFTVSLSDGIFESSVPYGKSQKLCRKY